MLHAPGVVALLPAWLARSAVDDHDGREPPKAQHDIAIGQRAARVSMRELITVDQRVQGIALNVQVVLRMPLPDRGAPRINFTHVVPIHHPLVLGAWLPAPHTRGGLWTH